jgi:cold-inducible RNA-binding protein
VKSIFVGNLNFSTSEGAVRQLFAAFGSVTQVKIMMDRDTGKPRGFAFVEMAIAEDGDKAIAALNGALLDERALNVNEARPRKQPGGFRDQHARARSGGMRW